MNSHPTALAKLDQAVRMLVEIQTVPEALEVADMAAAAQTYAKRAKLGLEAQNHAAEIKLRAERRAGELLGQLERGKGNRHTVRASNAGHSSEYAQALNEANATRQDANRWQKVAMLTDDAFETAIAEGSAGSKELSTAAILKKARTLTSKPSAGSVGPTCAESDLITIAEMGVRFGTVYADPPWPYGNQSTRAATNNHYPTMSIDEMAAMPVADLVADDGHLHLWTTNAFLFDARTVMEAWGFEYRSCFVWVKPQMGIGNYWRVSHEFLLLGKRGSCTFRDKSLMSWGEFRRGEHSAKPEPVYDLIEKASPGPYLELFARRQREGWASWGDQIEADLFFDGVV